MTIERSHGKARPGLPRASDLRVPPAREPSGNRAPNGRMLPGNDIGKGKGWKAALKRALGRDATGAVVEAVYADAFRLMSAFLRELPHDGANVRALVSSRARHAALEAYFGAQAAELGYDTEAGQAADDRASAHGQRAERLCVTALDVADRLARATPKAPVNVVDILTQGLPR